MARARILLVDDHELFRQGLASLVDAQPDMTVVGQAGDGFEALTLARDLRPDLVVLDITMPVCGGLEAVRLLRARFPAAELRILMLTVHSTDEELFEAIKAGADGYLLKSSSASEFLRGVRAALASEGVLPPKLAARLLGEFARLANSLPPAADAHGDEPDLTRREQEVLDWIATGATDREIADRLSISLHTVKSHVRNILAKLHAVNRRHAARLAARGDGTPTSPQN